MKSAVASTHPSKRTECSFAQPDVGIVELAVAERHVAQRHEGQIDAAGAALDHGDAVPDTFGEVRTREVAAHQLDVGEPHVLERVAGVARALDTRAHDLAVVDHDRLGHHAGSRSGRPIRTSTPGE